VLDLNADPSPAPDVDAPQSHSAIVLAAGRGRRFQHTGGVGTKALADCGGTTPLVWTLHRLNEVGFSSVRIVIGFEAERVEAAVLQADLDLPITLVYNQAWETSDSGLSLTLGADPTAGPTVLVYGDTLVTASLLRQLQAHASLGKAIPLPSVQGEATCVYRWSGPTLTRLIDAFAAELAGDPALQFETLLNRRLDDVSLTAVHTTSAEWCEVDRVEDLDAARALVERQRRAAKLPHG
jgi:choline kinase